MRVATLSAAILLASITSSYAGCHVAYWRFYFAEDTNTVMHVTDGGPCSTSIGTIAETSRVDSIQISQQPKHGSASWNNSFAYPKFRYQPSSGYKGADEFVISIVGSNNVRSGPANVKVSVDVQ